MSNIIARGQLSADVPNNGTFTVSYPSLGSAGTADAGAFYGAMDHRLVVGQGALNFPTDFDLAFGANSITVTNLSGATWTAGTDWILELRRQGKQVFRTERSAGGGGVAVNRASRADTILINLGAPDTADADGIAASQAITAAGSGAVLNGAIGATLDVPRNVVGAWTGAAVVTVKGFDEYGEPMQEVSASGAAFTGKKAFKRITSITTSADITGATFGTGDVLGLPVFLPGAAYVLRELQDGVAAAAGTIVPGLRAGGGSTGTTGDVRGTYDPSAAADGAKVFQLIAALPDNQYLGVKQFAG